MKEYWVRLYRHENDDYNELWKTKDDQYFARNTYCGGEWYYVSDPLGYCELDYGCHNDVIFHVCDSKYKELFTSSNGGYQFPCLRILQKREWDKIKDTVSVKEENADANFYVHAITGNDPSGLSNWLLTFKDPDIYGEDAKDYDENWTMFRTEEVERETLSTFDFVGIECSVEKVKMRHTICGAEWYEYYSGGKYMGAHFDKLNHGNMLSARDANEKVRGALKEIYPDATYRLSIVVPAGQWSDKPHERSMKFYQVEDYLLKGDYRRNHVREVINSERENPQFFTNYKAIKAIYPDCIMDYSL